LEFNVPFQHKYGYIRDERKCQDSDLVLSQEDKPQIHRTVCEISWEMGIHWCIQNAICLHFLPYLV